MTRYYDFHIHTVYSEGESNIEQLASTAKELGYSGICIVEFYKNEKEIENIYEKITSAQEEFGMEILLGLEARSVKELMFLKNKRKMFDILLVRGGDIRLNRIACETAEVDILTHPEFSRMDSGFNHVLARLAARNNVAIEINYRQVLLNSKQTRSRIMENIRNNIKLAKKFKAPIIICSGATSHFELRDPKVLISIGYQLGLDLKEAKEGLSKIPQKIISQTKERRNERWIMPGVKIVKS